MKFYVIIDQDSLDCDGPMHHTPVESELSLEELKIAVADIALFYDSIDKETTESGGTYLRGYSKTDEGFRRKELTFYELAEEVA